MFDRPFGHVRPGGRLSARELNRAMDAISDSSTISGDGIDVDESFGGRTISVHKATRVNIRIVSGSNPYAWEEVAALADGTWETTGHRSGTAENWPAYERNGNEDVAAGDVFEAELVPATADTGVSLWLFTAAVAGESAPAPVVGEIYSRFANPEDSLGFEYWWDGGEARGHVIISQLQDGIAATSIGGPLKPKFRLGVYAVSGTYKLVVNGNTTAAIAFDATAAEVESAIESAVGGLGVTVSDEGTSNKVGQPGTLQEYIIERTSGSGGMTMTSSTWALAPATSTEPLYDPLDLDLPAGSNVLPIMADIDLGDDSHTAVGPNAITVEESLSTPPDYLGLDSQSIVSVVSYPKTGIVATQKIVDGELDRKLHLYIALASQANQGSVPELPETLNPFTPEVAYLRANDDGTMEWETGMLPGTWDVGFPAIWGINSSGVPAWMEGVVVPVPPASGPYKLKSVDGVLAWVSDP